MNLRFGLKFGHDLIIISSDESADYNEIHCDNHYYERMIRDTKDQFTIEDYEVFQIVKR